MSLKPFHIILMAAAILMGAGVGWWGIEHYVVSGKTSDLVTAVVSLVGSILLLGYLFWFLKKMKSKGW